MRIEQRFVNLGLGLRRIYSVWLERKMVSLGKLEEGCKFKVCGVENLRKKKVYIEKKKLGLLVIINNSMWEWKKI